MLYNYYKAHFPFMFVITTEFERLEKTVEESFSNVPFKAFWDYETGFRIFDGPNKREEAVRTPVDVLKTIDGFPNRQKGGSVTVLRNFDRFLRETCTEHFTLQQMIINRKYSWRGMKGGQNEFRHVIMVCNDFPDFLPISFDDIPRYRFPLLKRGEIKKIVEPKFKRAKIKVTPMVEEMSVGMRQLEIENSIALSMATTGKLDPKIIMDYKIGKIRKFYEVEYSLPETEIGGLKVGISYLHDVQKSLTDEGRAYGLPYPKLILTVGYPGCGKSLLARIAADILGIQLLRLDMGVIFGGIVGESERNMREALAIADAMAPILIWIDEIEKGMAGFRDSGRTSGGIPERLLQTILTWLAEKKTPVILYATCNDIRKLPATLLRAGRTEDIFWVGLPHIEERKEIFKVQLNKYHRVGYGCEGASKYKIDQLAELTGGFSGSEIEKLVVKSMRTMFPEPVTTDSMLKNVPLIKTTSATKKEELEYMEKWARKMAINASLPDPSLRTEAERIIEEFGLNGKTEKEVKSE